MSYGDFDVVHYGKLETVLAFILAMIILAVITLFFPISCTLHAQDNPAPQFSSHCGYAGRSPGWCVCPSGYEFSEQAQSCVAHMSADEWLALVVMLQQQSAVCIAKEDRKFLGEMTNLLTLDDPNVPQLWQRKWLLALKRECRL